MILVRSLLKRASTIPFLCSSSSVVMSLQHSSSPSSFHDQPPLAVTADGDDSTCKTAYIPPISQSTHDLIREELGDAAVIEALEPIGASLSGVDLSRAHFDKDFLSDQLRSALEGVMAERGFVLFRNQTSLVANPDQLIAASELWGGREMHSTHGVHPATPGSGNTKRHIFRLSNDPAQGHVGVGPQWHNDGSFVKGTFSHVGYCIVQPNRGGGTQFAHQGAAFDALPKERQQFWERLTSVNSNSGVLHPCVHEHPISKRKSIWLHLGMTGAVIEELPLSNKEKEDGKIPFRLLNAFELKHLMDEYNDILNAGLQNGYTLQLDWQAGDCLFIDNLAVSHRAAVAAHQAAQDVGLRILHRTTVKAVQDLAPRNGLPEVVDIYNPNHPFGQGVWQGGGLGFRWDESIHMQN